MTAMTPTPPLELLRMLGRRLLFAIGFATLIGLLNSVISVVPTLLVVGRAWVVGALGLAASRRGCFSSPGLAHRQREAFARSQKLAFELERSELERQALDARMRLLQAQVQPHFLFPLLQSRAFPHVAEQDLVGEFNQLGGEVADQPLRA
jgi:hypothetical protein